MSNQSSIYGNFSNLSSSNSSKGNDSGKNSDSQRNQNIPKTSHNVYGWIKFGNSPLFSNKTSEIFSNNIFGKIKK